MSHPIQVDRRMKMNKEQQPLWELRDISKYFPGIKALDDMSITVQGSRIHGLMGQNGCGKSTLIKCLAGVHEPEEGTILYKGEQVRIKNPIISRKYGVATIYQEFSLIPTLTVAENIYLGRLPQNGTTKMVDWKQMLTGAEAILHQLELEIDPMTIVKNLSVAEQQLVEIAKALSAEASLLIMDEPTAALGIQEIKQLHAFIRKLSAKGIAVIYISHRLDEVVELVDYITVMKDGQSVIEFDKEHINIKGIVDAMVGESVEQHYPKTVNALKEVLVKVDHISTDNGVDEVSFTINKGEVFGLGGMMGSGRTEIARAMFGLDKLTGGSIEINGTRVRLKSPRDAIRHKIAFVTENRKVDGLFMNFASPANMTIAKISKILKNRFLQLFKEREASYDYIRKFQIHETAMDKSVKFLSGGNQQKVVISRWLFSEADLFILDEPTQGIDVSAKAEIYKLINELTAMGKSVLLISSDFEELLPMSDRIGIVKFGKIVGIADADQLNSVSIMEAPGLV